MNNTNHFNITQSPLAIHNLLGVESELFENLTIDYNPNKTDCETVCKWIDEENKIKPHMVAQNPIELENISKKGNSISIKIDCNLIGYCKLSEINIKNVTFYELGSVYVKPEFRKHKIGKFLIFSMLKENLHKLIYLITNQKAVEKICNDIGMTQVSSDEIPSYLLEEIESIGKLLPDDIVFINKKLEQYILNHKINKNEKIYF